MYRNKHIRLLRVSVTKINIYHTTLKQIFKMKNMFYRIRG